MTTEQTTPSTFLTTVATRVTNQLFNDFKHLEDDLLQRLKTQKNYKDNSSKQNNENITMIKEKTNQLHIKVAGSYTRNIDKFRIYATRNIFNPSKITRSDESSVDAVINAKSNEARERYSKVKSEYDQLTQEYRDLEVVLKDMRAALFNLRIGSQVFEDHNVNLAESVANLALYQANLLDLCGKSQVIVDQLNIAQPSVVTAVKPVGSRPQNQDNSILAGDLSDIMMLNENLR